MSYPVKVRYGKQEINGRFELVELIEKIEEMVNNHGTSNEEEKKR